MKSQQCQCDKDKGHNPNNWSDRFFIDLYSHIKIKYRQLQFLSVQLVIASISSSILAILNQILETTITTLIDLN